MNKFKLTDNFVQQYKNKKAPFGFNGLGELTYMRTYSRIKADGKNEVWYETVRRVVEGCFNMQKSHIEQHGLGWNAHKAQNSAQIMYDRIFNMKFLPPGRGLWAMGTPITEEKGLNMALNNCAMVSTDGLKHKKATPFCFLMDSAMLGVGVSFDTKGSGQIDIIKPELEKAYIFPIPDDREGWVKSVELLINSYFDGTGVVTFNYDLIRKAGAPIKGFGGVSSGFQPLKECHDSLRKILDRNVGSPITITTLADIMNLIGKCVVSGNIRRSASLSLGDPLSKEYVDLKNYKVNPYREEFGWTSNNSILAELGMDYEDAAHRTQINGEPGYFWLDNAKNYSRMADAPDNKDHRAVGTNPCCLIGDTLIAVADGRNAVKIKDLVGTDYPIYTVKNSQVTIGNAVKTWKTRDHAEVWKLTLDDGSTCMATPDHKIMLRNGEYCQLKDLQPGQSLMPFNSYVSNNRYRQIASNTSRDRRQYRMLAEYRKKVSAACIKARAAKRHLYYTKWNCSVCGKEIEIPKRDMDIRKACSPKCVAAYKIKMYNHKVSKVEFYGYEDVYDITVDDTHNFGIITSFKDDQYITSSGIFVHNCEQTLDDMEVCTLVESFPNNHDTIEEYITTLKYAYLYAKTVTLGSTHWPETNRVLLRNRRIGCSMSGIAQFITSKGIHTLKEWCMKGYDALKHYDEVYSDWLAIPRSIKMSSCKPSGTVSLLAGATPGMHYPESRFYIRRMRISNTSDLLEPLKNSGYKIEDCFGDKSSKVVEIPVDAGAGIRTVSDLSMWEQLSLAAFLQKYWADNQVSCTVTFDPKTEGPHIKHALEYFQYQLKGISFLPRLEKGAYKQMPYEKIDEATYNKLVSSIKPLRLRGIENEKAEVERFCSNDTCTLP